MHAGVCSVTFFSVASVESPSLPPLFLPLPSSFFLPPAPSLLPLPPLPPPLPLSASPRYSRSRSRSYSPYRGGYSPRYNRRYRSRSPPRGRDQAGTRVTTGQHCSSVLLTFLSLFVCVRVRAHTLVRACVLAAVLCVNTEIVVNRHDLYSLLSPLHPLFSPSPPLSGTPTPARCLVCLVLVCTHRRGRSRTCTPSLVVWNVCK